MKKLSLQYILYLALFCSFSSMAQTGDYDAVYQKLGKKYTLNTDGKIDYRFEKTQKLQTYRAFNRLFGETFIVYDPEYQSLNIDNVKTVMANGKVVTAPENAFNKVLPRVARNAPAFNHLREMVITHTGLEKEATINLSYTLETAKGFYPALMGTEVLVETQPVVFYTIDVIVPRGQKLYYRLFNSTVKPQISDFNEMVRYHWQIAGNKVKSTERDQVETYPVLIFSTLSGYEELVDFFNNQPAFSYEKETSFQPYITELEKKETSKSELVFSLQKEVVKNLKLFPVPEKYVGYQLRAPGEVWRSNGGTVAEKALLLATMLNQAGIHATPVMVFDGKTFDRNIGNLSNLEDWIVHTTIPGKEPVYLSVKQVNAFDMATLLPDKVFIALNRNGLFDIAKTKTEKNRVSMKGMFTIDTAHMLTGNITGELSGPSNPYLALLRKEENIKHYFSGLSSSNIKEVNLMSLSPENANYSCQVEKKGILKKDSNFYYLALPKVKTGIENLEIQSLPKKRTTSYRLANPVEENIDFTIVIPAGLALITKDIDISVSNPVGSFLYQVREKTGTVQVKKSLSLKKEVVTPDLYADFKELIDNWNLRQYGELIFRK